MINLKNHFKNNLCATPKTLYFIVFSFIFQTLFTSNSFSQQIDIKYWSNLVIPLPKKMEITGISEFTPFESRLIPPETKNPCIEKAIGLLIPFARGLDGFDIRLALSSESACPETVRSSLASLPNGDQAYSISPIIENGSAKGLLLSANKPLGLLYAARTLEQLLNKPGETVSVYTKIKIPMVKILDWPDMEERGEWGGSAIQDIAWLAQYKMNVLEFLANLGFDSEGKPVATLDRLILNETEQEGVKPVPYIPHVEGLSYTGLYKYYPEVKAKPDPSKPLPTDWSPPIDFSVPKMTELLSDWIKQILSYKNVNSVSIWLSEMDSHIYSDFPAYKGVDPYVMETRSIRKAFEKAKADSPSARLRILTTQTSYPVNNLVIDELSPDMGLTYYDGGRTYDSSHNPMIYPLLENYAASGRWLGVYPQLSGAFRTVFPFTSPQFIRERVNEFTDKKVKNMTGYTTPSNRYFEFNVIAAAEWSWNSKGRTPEEFAEAYATRKGIKNPALFGQWAESIGKAGWDLAGSRSIRLLLFNKGQTFNPDGSVGNEDFIDNLPVMEFGKGMLYEFKNSEHLKTDIDLAGKSLEIARQLNDPETLYESECVYSAAMLVKSLKDFSDARLMKKKQAVPALEKALTEIDVSAKNLTENLYLWGMIANPMARDSHPSRFYDTVTAAQHTATMARRYTTKLGIKDPEPSARYKEAGIWNDSTFGTGKRQTLIMDVTSMVTGKGQYDVTFMFDSGTVGLDIQSVSLLKGSSPETASPVDTANRGYHAGRFDRYGDYWVSIPENTGVKGDKYYVKADVTLPDSEIQSEKASSSGRILFCKSWRQ